MTRLQILVPTVVVVCALMAPLPAHASRRGDMVFAGWMIAGYSALPLHTFSFVSMATKGTDATPEDLLFANTMLLPFVGPAIIGTSMVESHPLTWVVCAAMWGMSILQTAGVVIAISGHVKQARHCRRTGPTPGTHVAVVPAVSPAGVGLVGVF